MWKGRRDLEWSGRTLKFKPFHRRRFAGRFVGDEENRHAKKRNGEDGV